MHEMAIAEGILGIVEDAARDQGFSRVKEIRLEIGALSGVEVEALRFCLGAVLHDSVAAGARIELETLPGAGWCLVCGETVPIAALYDACPQCGGYQVQATGGTEMRVKDLLVEN
jgi:hydrogenase nickel incorporation protein HypA/HybF